MQTRNNSQQFTCKLIQIEREEGTFSSLVMWLLTSIDCSKMEVRDIKRDQLNHVKMI